MTYMAGKCVTIFLMVDLSSSKMMIILCKVDLEYPNELHYLHNDYLLAPESLPITYDI